MVRDFPRCWSTDANNSAHRQKVTDNLYLTLVWAQQASVFLTRAIAQSESELRKERELRKNYAKQGKLVISLGEARKKVGEKVKVLESANVGLLLKVKKLEATLAQAGESESSHKEEVMKLQMLLPGSRRMRPSSRLILSSRRMSTPTLPTIWRLLR